jgi:GntR family transcriptional regulator/MocR family aminotransferase
MSSDWSTRHGIDLHLELAREGSRRVAIEEALRQAIRDGRLPLGSTVPSTRVLSRDLTVARGTVSEAYDQLVAEGWLAARQGAGTTVAWTGEPDHADRARPPGRDGVAPRHDFRPGSPDISSFPRHEWSAAVKRSLRTAPDAALGYSDPQGLSVVRRGLAEYLSRSRGVRTDPRRVIVCAGFAQALSLLMSVLHRLGTRVVAMENPCIGAYRDAAAAGGLTIVSLSVDEHGADPTPLVVGDRSSRDAGVPAGAALLTPAHQYPTGSTLAPSRRSAFIEWARAHGGYVIEDDYDGEFRYDRQPVGALQGMDPERVVYVGTASKSLAPGLRLGWMALPDALVEPLSAAKSQADRQTGAIEQLALAELIASGGLDRHIRRSRLRYRHRRDALIAAMASVPGIRVTGIAAGLHAVVELPEPGADETSVDEANTVAALAAAGVAVQGLGDYWHLPGIRPQGLVVGYGTPPEHDYPAALDALTATLARALPRH